MSDRSLNSFSDAASGHNARIGVIFSAPQGPLDVQQVAVTPAELSYLNNNFGQAIISAEKATEYTGLNPNISYFDGKTLSGQAQTQFVNLHDKLLTLKANIHHEADGVIPDELSQAIENNNAEMTSNDMSATIMNTDQRVRAMHRQISDEQMSGVLDENQAQGFHAQLENISQDLSVLGPIALTFKGWEQSQASLENAKTLYEAPDQNLPEHPMGGFIAPERI